MYCAFMDVYDDVIIGSGYAGLSLGVLLSKEKRNICIVESHSEIGGCAGFFKRKEFLFDVGATTFSGLLNNRPVSKFAQITGIRPETLPLETPLVINLEGVKLKRFRDLERWIQELEKKFPQIPHRKFWRKLDRVASNLWRVLEEVSFFPPVKWTQWLKFLNPRLLKFTPQLISFFWPLRWSLPREYKYGPLKDLIDELLLISTQAKSPQTSLAMGSLGLTYPEDMSYPVGGMYAFGQKMKNQITHSGGRFLFKAEVSTKSFFNYSHK